MDHPYFGTVATVHGELSWEGQVELDGRAIPVWLSTSETCATELDAAARFPCQVKRFDAAARAALCRDLVDGAAARAYLDHHLAVLAPEVIDHCFARRRGAVGCERVLGPIELTRVYLSPDDPDRFAVFDYSLGEDVTSYVLAVEFDATGAIAGIVMES